MTRNVVKRVEVVVEWADPEAMGTPTMTVEVECGDLDKIANALRYVLTTITDEQRIQR